MFPDPTVHTHTHTRAYTWTADAHTHTPRYTSSMGFRFDFFWTPARPLRRHRHWRRPALARRTNVHTAPSGRSFCLLPARRGAEDHQPCVRASVCVCECTCASDARGAAGRPCSHTGSVDGSSSVLRWSSYSVYALCATYLYYTRRTLTAVLAQSIFGVLIIIFFVYRLSFRFVFKNNLKRTVRLRRNITVSHVCPTNIVRCVWS